MDDAGEGECETATYTSDEHLSFQVPVPCCKINPLLII
jgi:hypothetical protein